MKRPMILPAIACILGIKMAFIVIQEKRMLFFFFILLCAIIIQYVRVTTGKCKGFFVFSVVFLLAYFSTCFQMRVQETTGQFADSQVHDFSGTVCWQKEGGQLLLTNAYVDHQRISGDVLLYYIEETLPNMIGDQVEFQSQWYLFSKATNPGQFDARAYYEAQGVIGYGKTDTLHVVGCDQNYSIRKKIFDVRIYLHQTIRSLAEEKRAGIYSAILLGDKSEITNEVYSVFQNAGILHIFVVSGLHVSLLGMGCYRLLWRLSKRRNVAVLLSILVMGAYAYMTGAQSACLRAYLMFLAELGAIMLGRTYDRASAALLAFVLLLLWHPLQLFQAGFLLSFGSVMAITCVVPLLNQIILKEGEETKKREKKKRKEYGRILISSILFSAGLPLVTMPIVCWFFYQVPNMGPVVNFIVLPLVPVMFFSLLLGIAAYILTNASTFSQILLLPADWISDFYLKIGAGVTDVFDSVALTGRPMLWQVAVYYALLFGGLFLFGRKYLTLNGTNKAPSEKSRVSKQQLLKENGVEMKKKLTDRRSFRLGMFLLMVLTAPSLLKRVQPSGLEVVMLDVGQGDGILLRFPNGVTGVVDGGSTSKEHIWEKILEPALKYYGIAQVDFWILTHPDRDHTSAFTEYTHSFTGNGKKVKMLLLPKTKDAKKIWGDILCDRKEDTVVYYILAGEKLSIGDAKLCVLSPDSSADPKQQETNDLSLVFTLQYGENQLLFCGDISEQVEKELLRKGLLTEVSVLKIAHHGSKYSTSEDFLRCVRPQAALISVGKNTYGHPSENTLKRLQQTGIQVYRTDELGAIILKLNRKKWNISKHF